MKKIKKRNILSFGLLLLLIAVFLFPYYVMVVGAFKSQMALQLIPPDLNPFINLTGKNADYVWRKTEIFLWLTNSAIVSLGTAVKEIKVPDSGVISEDLKLDFIDTRYGQLQVSKTTTLLFGDNKNEEYRVEGVKFNVYEAVADAFGAYEKDGQKYKKSSDKPVAAGYTDSNGIYTSYTLN